MRPAYETIDLSNTYLPDLVSKQTLIHRYALTSKITTTEHPVILSVLFDRLSCTVVLISQKFPILSFTGVGKYQLIVLSGHQSQPNTENTPSLFLHC